MGINLGAPSVIQFIPQPKQGGTGVTQNIYLPRRSIYIMSGASRVAWKHGICKVSKENGGTKDAPAPSWNPEGKRRSLTLRSTKTYNCTWLQKQIDASQLKENISPYPIVLT